MQAFEIEEEEMLLETLHRLFLNIHYRDIIRPYSQPFVTSRFAEMKNCGNFQNVLF